MIQEILNVVTWMLVAAILAIAAWATMYIKTSSRSTKLIEKRRWIGQIPSALSTLGVLGTFIGITIGLCNFDTSNLDESIPLLLSGLKTAFFTSIAGMGTSMYLSKLVSNLYDKTDKGVSDINIAAGLITKAVSEMSTDNIDTLHTMMGQQEKQLQLFERIHQDQIAAVELLKANKDSNAVLVNGLKIINANIKEGVGEIKELGNHINSLENSIQAEFRGLNTVVKTQFGEFETFIDQVNTKIAGDILQKLGILETKSEQAYDLLHNISSDTNNISSINDNVATSLEALGNLDASEQHVSEEIDKLSDVLQTEVGELNTVVKSQFAELSAFINQVNTKIADDILQKLGMLEAKSGMAYDLLHSISSDTSNISSINDNIATSLEALGNLDASEQHVSEEIDKLSGVLQTEVGELNTVVKSQFAELSAFINQVNTKIADDILQKLGMLEAKSGMAYDLLHSISSDTSNISSINDNVATSLEALGNLDASEQHVSEEIDKLGEKMGQDISNIVVRMDDTDKLLSNKLDEFTKLLEKNNVDALSEYLKKFATDFQRQMNVLINKLVTDNFKELNKSIDNLNYWQQENKTMVADMIKQYREMVVNFEDTSSTMSDVSKTIDKLVSDGGKFSDLIQALNEVMLEDKNFVRVIDKLKEAAEINHNNSVTLNQSANSLNGWIVTQKNFVRGVERLIAKLDEISKFKDYNSEFWTDTKKKLQEGVNMLNKGSEQLNSQVAVIDKQFYARLNTTLANLDACIQAMYNGKIR